MSRGTVAMVAALALAALAAPSAHAQDATVVPIQITGAPAERLNLVVLGDGYTAADLPKYRQQVDKHLNVLWSIEPFRSYRNYFNVYMVEVVSPVSGISCDPDDGNVRRDTPLHLEYATTCPAQPLARGITFGTGGQAAVDRIAGTIPGVTPQNRQVLALANTDTYGGIGGTNATTSGGNSLGPLITPHELGHSLGGLQDEYPYSERGVPGPRYTGGEPTSIHHTLLTEAQMVAQRAKWWRWLGEESESGGVIGRYESGQYASSGIWRPSQHSMMRWIGNYFDQVSRERMTQRISGRRGTAALALSATPAGEVGPTDVVWVETPHPVHHELAVTWRVNGTVVPGTRNGRNLKLADLRLAAGDTVQVTVQDPTTSVRDPAIRDSAAMTQTRQWTVRAQPSPPAPVQAAFTGSTPNQRAVGGDDVVYVETTHPLDRVLEVMWRLDGQVVQNPDNRRNLNLADQGLSRGRHTLSATLTGGDTREWTVDNTTPTAPAELSKPLTSLPRARRHLVYFEQFTMGLKPADDQPGFVVGEFRLDRDGWHNFYGWPDAPPGTPYRFTPRGTEIKALIYGNLGPGGVSKAPFEPRAPGYGTHTVEHRAIDAAGNIGAPDEFRATVLPGGSPACTTTVRGAHNGRLVVARGVTCLDGTRVNGRVVVRAGASLVASDATINGRVVAEDAAVVHLFGTRVNGGGEIVASTGGVVAAGTTVNGSLTLFANRGAILAGNVVNGRLACYSNSAGVNDYGAENRVTGRKSGDCAGL